MLPYLGHRKGLLLLIIVHTSPIFSIYITCHVYPRMIPSVLQSLWDAYYSHKAATTLSTAAFCGVDAISTIPLSETQKAVVALGTLLGPFFQEGGGGESPPSRGGGSKRLHVSLLMLTRTREAGVLLRDAFRDVLAHTVQLLEERSAGFLGEAAAASGTNLGELHREANEMERLASLVRKWRCDCFIGGVPIENDRQRIASGGHDPAMQPAAGASDGNSGGGSKIVVGTPGRISDLVSEGTLNLNYARLLVVDAADVLLKPELAMKEVLYIKGQLPVRGQTLTFATANRWRWPRSAIVPTEGSQGTAVGEPAFPAFGVYGTTNKRSTILIPADAPIARIARFPSLFYQEPSFVTPVAIDTSLDSSEGTLLHEEDEMVTQEHPRADRKGNRWTSRKTPQL
eukprot:gb/GECG01003746.1/.p1 GENE.gb/GECG01003746.1/~~gb/GECG01003746.1/.p1  ORF type:complete len:399 (+),score=33.71 gb/GECG01003746.1/:1-1197(+)